MMDGHIRSANEGHITAHIRKAQHDFPVGSGKKQLSPLRQVEDITFRCEVVTPLLVRNLAIDKSSALHQIRVLGIVGIIISASHLIRKH